MFPAVFFHRVVNLFQCSQSSKFPCCSSLIVSFKPSFTSSWKATFVLFFGRCLSMGWFFREVEDQGLLIFSVGDLVTFSCALYNAVSLPWLLPNSLFLTPTICEIANVWWPEDVYMSFTLLNNYISSNHI